MRHLILVLCCLPFLASSQPYVEGGNTRHRFAQMNLGLGVSSMLSSQSLGLAEKNGSVIQQPAGRTMNTNFIIGGTHFWGHADFYVAFPLLKLKRTDFASSIETGAKLYPWRLESLKIRPFVGVAWQPTSFKYKDGAEIFNQRTLMQLGFSYLKNGQLLEIGAGIMNKIENRYYVNSTEYYNIKPPRFKLYVNYKFCFETTLGAEKNWQNGRTAVVTDTLSKLGRLNGFTLGIGVSSAIFLNPADYNKYNQPYLGEHTFSQLYADLGVGYYWHKPDLQLNLAYRKINAEQNAYEYFQNIKRSSFVLECYKFIADYHGFVPFAGLNISHEKVSISEGKVAVSNQYNRSFFRPGITLGWDIRPNELQAWYLRTNLRYTPALRLKLSNDQDFSFDQLEINFIQVVVFPGRFL